MAGGNIGELAAGEFVTNAAEVLTELGQGVGVGEVKLIFELLEVELAEVANLELLQKITKETKRIASDLVWRRVYFC